MDSPEPTVRMGDIVLYRRPLSKKIHLAQAIGLARVETITLYEVLPAIVLGPAVPDPEHGVLVLGLRAFRAEGDDIVDLRVPYGAPLPEGTTFWIPKERYDGS